MKDKLRIHWKEKMSDVEVVDDKEINFREECKNGEIWNESPKEEVKEMLINNGKLLVEEEEWDKSI
jgi:hypothetical protein